MAKKPATEATYAPDAAPRDAGTKHFTLRLYLAGLTHQSQEAIRTVTAICDEQLAGKCTLEVIDIYQEPILAKGDGVIAVPTLIRKLPLPQRRLVGNLTDAEKILAALGLRSS